MHRRGQHHSYPYLYRMATRLNRSGRAVRIFKILQMNPCDRSHIHLSLRLYYRLLHAVRYCWLHVYDSVQQVIDNLRTCLLANLLNLFELLLCILLCLFFGLFVA